MKAKDLEKRLINFSVSIIKGWKYLDKSFASEHLSKQSINLNFCLEYQKYQDSVNQNSKL
jgi:hypothetical protein